MYLIVRIRAEEAEGIAKVNLIYLRDVMSLEENVGMSALLVCLVIVVEIFYS